MQKVTAVYFSPTGGTKRYVQEVAKHLSAEFDEIDLTNPANRAKDYQFGPDDLVVFGVPVYFGRVPQVGIFGRFKGNGAKAVYIAAYGNGQRGDALREESDICREKGFIGIAGADVIAPHSYSKRAGKGRPNADDIRALGEFAAQIKQILESGVCGELKIDGNAPYKKYGKSPFIPRTSAACNKCGVCAEKCPVEAIPAENPMLTDKDKCVACLACVKICPKNARSADGLLFKTATFLFERFLWNGVKKPEFFHS